MKITWSVILLIGLGIVAALSAAVFTASLSAQQIRDVAKLPTPEVTMLIAKADIPSMSPVTSDLVAEKVIAKKEAPLGFYTDASQIIGKRVSLDMFEGQAFTLASFPAEGTGAFLAAQLPPGKRAVNVQLSSYESLDGLLYPGSFVDVLASFRVSKSGAQGQAVSTTLLQNIEVLAVANETVGSVPDVEADKSKKRLSRGGPLVTLLVDSKQAEALQLAQRFGNISLALRNPSDDIEVDSVATLLNGGRLAQMAGLMGTRVDEDSAANGGDVSYVGGGKNSETPSRAAAMLRVDIIRGLQTATRAFELPKSREVN